MVDAEGEPVGLAMGFQAGGLIGLYLGFSLATISVLTDAENIQRTASLMCFPPFIFSILLGPFLARRRKPVILTKEPLIEAREKAKKDNLVFIRLEQLYPFPAKALVKELKPYAKNAKFYWCQEEPKNMGAWFSVRDYIQWTLDNIKANNNKISYIGRSPVAGDASGLLPI